MIDREKVIKGLQIERECVSRDCDRDCSKCDLVQDREWLLSVYDDALELLKEREPMKPIKTLDGNGNLWRDCGECGGVLPKDARHCPTCGKKVDWNV